MRYLYYIIAIVLVFSALAAYGLFDTRVEISQPALSVNDRIFSKAELDAELENEAADMTRDEAINALIERQLLIQEAIKTKINAEESFRRSVQNFYEQSLVKILLDRKMKEIVVDVTTEEVARFETLSTKTVRISKLSYPGMADYTSKRKENVEIIKAPFLNLSDHLKFLMIRLEKGQSSKPRPSGGGKVVVYRLESVEPGGIEPAVAEKLFDVKKVSLFIQEKKKEERLKEWLDSLRETAEIWREE